MNDELQEYVKRMRERAAPPEPPRSFTCAACEDTGIVFTDDGLDDQGRRVRARSGRPCTSIVHRPEPNVVDDPTTTRFS